MRRIEIETVSPEKVRGISQAVWEARTLDGRVVFVHKVALDELDGEGRFSDAWGRR
jgi:hypothetical protein